MGRRTQATEPSVALICAVLVAACFLAYARTLGNEFVAFDDQSYVTANAIVQQGLTIRGAAWAFTTGHGANWHPLTWLSHMLDCELFGLRPGLHHLTSLLLHAANSLLLFVLLLRMTGDRSPSGFAAGLFALHPLHVESVAWVAERKDLLSTLLFLLALGAYARYAARPAWGRLVPAVLLCAAGLMAKPMLVTFPFVLLLLDVWPLARLRLFPGAADAPYFPTSAPIGAPAGAATGARTGATGSLPARGPARGRGRTRASGGPVPRPLPALLLEKIPFFVLCAASSVVTMVVQRHWGAVQSAAQYPLSRRLPNAIVSYLRYLCGTLWPVKLAPAYPYPDSWPAWLVLLAGAVFAGASVAAILLARRRGYLFTGWFWFAGTLVPVIGLVQVGTQSMADRYTYLPSIGLFIIIGWGAADAASRWPAMRRALPAAGGAALIVLGALTWVQVGHWRNTAALFEHTIAVGGPNVVAYNVMGNLLATQGRTDEAIENFRRALEMEPDPETFAHLGMALAKKGDFEGAIAQYEAALRLAPDAHAARGLLAQTLHHLGRTDLALAAYSEALGVSPDDAPLRTNYAACLAGAGRLDEAIAQYGLAIRSDPSNADARNNLGVALGRKGMAAEAAAQYEEALRLRPDYAEAHYNLGMLLLGEGRRSEALDHLSEALRLRPGFPPAEAALRALQSGTLPGPPPSAATTPAGGAGPPPGTHD